MDSETKMSHVANATIANPRVKRSAKRTERASEHYKIRRFLIAWQSTYTIPRIKMRLSNLYAHTTGHNLRGDEAVLSATKELRSGELVRPLANDSWRTAADIKCKRAARPPPHS